MSDAGDQSPQGGHQIALYLSRDIARHDDNTARIAFGSGKEIRRNVPALPCLLIAHDTRRSRTGPKHSSNQLGDFPPRLTNAERFDGASGAAPFGVTAYFVGGAI